MHPQPTRNRRNLPRQNRDCVSESRNLEFMDAHYLAFDPGFALEEKYRVRVRWIPFQLRIKGKGERSVYSEYKVKYSYLDARRWANMRGGLVLRGPLKIYDTRPALIGGLFARKHGKFME